LRTSLSPIVSLTVIGTPLLNFSTEYRLNLPEFFPVGSIFSPLITILYGVRAISLLVVPFQLGASSGGWRTFLNWITFNLTSSDTGALLRAECNALSFLT